MLSYFIKHFGLGRVKANKGNFNTRVFIYSSCIFLKVRNRLTICYDLYYVHTKLFIPVPCHLHIFVLT